MEVIKSQTIGGFRVHIFTKKDQAMISNYKDFDESMLLGGITGFEEYYESFIPNNYSISYTFDDANVKKLTFNRIQAVIGVMPDYHIYLDTLRYDPNFILDEGLDFVFCHNTQKGLKFIKHFNVILNKLKANGEYQSIMGPSLFPLTHNRNNNTSTN